MEVGKNTRSGFHGLGEQFHVRLIGSLSSLFPVALNATAHYVVPGTSSAH